MKSQHHTSEQHVQLQVLGDIYNPPKAADQHLSIVDESWFEDSSMEQVLVAAQYGWELLKQMP